MAPSIIVCEQAIFTSIRSAMGEGYRIVAASRGLRPEEKQAITRTSPSHDALCGSEFGATGPAVAAASFFPLPTGRLCAAYSCPAGAEHTGRGGDRVYTLNLVFDAADFPKCAFNPFVLIRALQNAGLAEPQLAPNPVLATLELSVDPSDVAALDKGILGALPAPRRACALRCLMEGKSVAAEAPAEWVRWAEAILLGVPGPLRSKYALGAGLRFSVGRGHQLQVFHDPKRLAPSKAVAQGMCFVDSATSDDPPDSPWFTFVGRHWESGDLPGLMRRTSRPFTDCSAAARERVGRLYNAIDAMPRTESAEILALVGRTFAEPARDVEHEIQSELCDIGHKTLVARFDALRWLELRPLWRPLLALWRRGDQASPFARPLIETTLRKAVVEDPLAACETALELVREWPRGVDKGLLDGVLNGMLTQINKFVAQLPSPHRARFAEPARRWQTARPNCPQTARLAELCLPTPTTAQG